MEEQGKERRRRGELAGEGDCLEKMMGRWGVNRKKLGEITQIEVT